MEVVVMDNFKATYCGAEYHNIDGTGWPYAVVMENQGSVLDGTYESKMYYPERTYELTDKRRDNGTCVWESWDDGTCVWGIECSECGSRFSYETGACWKYCPSCGAKVVS